MVKNTYRKSVLGPAKIPKAEHKFAEGTEPPRGHICGTEELRRMMEYLGYTVYGRDGKVTEAAYRTSDALTGAVYCAELVSQIATEYLKHDPDFRKPPVSAEVVEV